MASSARIEELSKKFEENPRRYFAPLANEYRKAGDLAQAIAICRAHLPQQPGHMSGHVVYGQALFESGALDEARGVFETALQLDPENLIALRYLGDIALRNGEPRLARLWYQRVLDADPRNEEIQLLLAEVDGMRTPPAAAPAIERAPEAAIALDEPMTVEGAEALPAEIPPAVLDAAAEVLEEPLLLDGFSMPGSERGSEGAAETEPVEFEATSLADSFGVGRDEALREDAYELPAVEMEGFEATHLETHLEMQSVPLGEMELEVGEAGEPAGESAAVEETLPVLSFDDEPGDATPLQVGPGEDEVPPTTFGLAESDDARAELPLEEPVMEDVAFDEPAEEPVAASGGFVTETMAELYLRQGHREEALAVYRQLVDQSGGDARLRARLAELERASEPTIRSFLVGIASRRPRALAFDASEPVAGATGEWRAPVSEVVGDALPSDMPTEVMGWGADSSVVAEIPRVTPAPADAPAEPEAIPAEITPAVLDGMEEIAPGPETDAGESPADAGTAEPPAPEATARRVPPFSLDESAVPYEMPTAPAAFTTPEDAPTVGAASASQPGSLDELFGNREATEADSAAASTLAQAFAPVTESTPLAGRPAVPARDELSLDRVFRGDEGERETRPAGGFSFDQFFGSRTPHAGSMTVPPTPATPPSSSSSRGEPTPPSNPKQADPDDIQQFNSWLQGLKKR